MFEKILIANRGEIACRIIKTARKMGIKTVAVCSDKDIGARHTKLSDETIVLGGSSALESYLVFEKIIDAAKQSGAQAIHPGYGFLSENAAFAEICEKENIKFIGPSAKAIRDMGLKDSAKKIALAAGVPILSGYMGETSDFAKIKLEAEKIGFPLLVKAVAGGGGRGIRRVDNLKELENAIQSASREAISAFNDPRLMLEKLVQRPRHVEVQVFGDSFGNVVHIFDRDCSVQRRRQKLIEEAPAPAIRDEVRQAMFEASIKLAKQVNYQNAGTVEFIVDADNPNLDGFWFLEMNTRLQVEHPVSEAISGLDFVEWQLRIAAGEKLPLSQNEIASNGHAIEARIVAEDANKDFLPCGGHFHFGGGQNSNIRRDFGYENGDNIPTEYDSLVEKVISYGENRALALANLDEFLQFSKYSGFANNAGYVQRIIGLEDFTQPNLNTLIIEENSENLKRKDWADIKRKGFAAQAAFFAKTKNKSLSSFDEFSGFRLNASPNIFYDFDFEGKNTEVSLVLENGFLIAKDENGLAELPLSGFQIYKKQGHETYVVFEGEIDGAKYADFIISFDKISMYHKGENYYYHLTSHAEDLNQEMSGDEISAHLPGKIAAIEVKIGDEVKAGQAVIILEAMKMEHILAAPRNAIVKEVSSEIGQLVKLGQVLVRFEE